MKPDECKLPCSCCIGNRCEDSLSGRLRALPCTCRSTPDGTVPENAEGSWTAAFRKDNPIRSPKAFKTPTGANSYKTLSDGVSKSRILCSGGHVSYNPFEVSLDSLHLPACSPSVFLVRSPSCKEECKFEWTIDEMANLKPALIDETTHRDAHQMTSLDLEEKAQRAIETFFSQNSVVPSPWGASDEPSVVSPGRAPTANSGTGSNRCGAVFVPVESLVHGKEVWTQTELTIPPHIDLEKILGQYFTFRENQALQHRDAVLEDSAIDIKEVLSSSSLRRKLFFSHDKLSTFDFEEDDPLHLPPASPASKCSAGLDEMSSGHLPPSPAECDHCITNASPVGNGILTPGVSPIYAQSLSPRQVARQVDGVPQERCLPSPNSVSVADDQPDVSMRNAEAVTFYMTFADQSETSLHQKPMDFSPVPNTVGKLLPTTERSICGGVCTRQGGNDSIDSVRSMDCTGTQEKCIALQSTGISCEFGTAVARLPGPPAVARPNGVTLSGDSAYFGGTSDEGRDVSSFAALPRSDAPDSCPAEGFEGSVSTWVPTACSTPARQ